jgi:hypothetical protein
MQRKGFNKAVEGYDQRQRVSQGMSSGGKGKLEGGTGAIAREKGKRTLPCEFVPDVSCGGIQGPLLLRKFSTTSGIASTSRRMWV